jgi:O-antigen ligase
MPNTQRLFNFVLIAFCGTWLLSKGLSGPLLILLLGIAFVGHLKKENQFQVQFIHLTWLLLFVLYSSSLFWSGTPDWSALERKLALLALPLLFSFKWKDPLPIAQMWLAHTIACLVLIVIAYYDAIMCQLTLGNSVRCFSTTYFSQLHHPSYFSAFLIFSIIGLLLGKVAWFRVKARWISWLLILIFASMHLHLGTLAGIMALGMVLMIFTIYRLLQYLGTTKSIVIGALFLMTCIVLALLSKDIRADAQNAKNFTRSYIENPKAFVEGRKEPLQGNEVRLILWTASVEIGSAHPFGLGLGGLEPALSKKLIAWGYPQQAKKEFNPHNQFLQIWNEIGYIGVLLFVGLLAFINKAFYNKRQLSGLLLSLVFIVFCLFESILQRESGIVFFLCWFTALSYWPKNATT